MQEEVPFAAVVAPPAATEPTPVAIAPTTPANKSMMLDLKGGRTSSKLCSEGASPLTGMFHVIFMIAVVFLLFALPMVTTPMNAIALVVLAGAIDFYFIKNISGRRLVGLRWWIAFTPSGREMIKYECRLDDRSTPSSGQTIFWYPFYIFHVVWFILIVLNIIAANYPNIFACIYNLVLIRYNYRYFNECSTKRSTQVERLIDQHGYDKISRIHRGSLVSHVNENIKHDD